MTPPDVPGAETAVWIIAAPVVTAVVSVLIPLLNGLLTKYTFKGKGLLTLLLTLVLAGVMNAVTVDGDAVFSVSTLTTWVYSATIAVLTYYQVYKPLNITSNLGGRLSPGSGIGPAASPPPDPGVGTPPSV